MRSILAAVLLCSAATTVYAADPAPPAPQASPDAQIAAADGVKSYPASYFAAQQPNTAYDVVIRLPGFSLDDGTSVRGFAGAAGNVLIDGQRPTSKTDDLINVLKRIHAGQIERVDVIRGGAPGIDMQGKTVVANVILKKTGGLTGDLALANIALEDGRDVFQTRLEGSWRGDGRTITGMLFTGRFFDDGEGSGPHFVYGPGGAVEDFSHQKNRAGGIQSIATGSFETPLAGGTFKINALLQDQPYRNNNDDLFEFAGTQQEHDHQDQFDGELGLHYDRGLGKGLTLETLALQHVNKTGYRSLFDTSSDAEAFDETDLSTETIVRGILHWSPTSTLTVDGGGEFAYNWLRTRTNFSDNGVPIDLPAANVIVQEKRGEAFTTATWRATPKFTVEAGLRLEDSTISSSGDVVLSKTLFFPKPRLLLTWSPDTDNQIRLRAEREVGQLDFKNFAASATLNGNGVVAGNPNLEPQSDWAFEVAYDHHFMKSGVISLTLRHLILKDVVDRIPVISTSGVFDEPGNIGGGSENDIVGSFTVPLERVIPGGEIRGTVTWQMSAVTDPTTGQKRQISGQLPVNGDLHFSQDLPQWKLKWGVDANLGNLQRFYRFNEIDSYRVGTYDTVYVERRLPHSMSLRFELDNAGSRPLDFTRQVYDGLRNIDPLLFTDSQQHKFGLELYTRLRVNFG
ncbi:MAG TPA: TonB-dependent receptor [Caulobacteraceae bacterium]|jgi:outer membrane receptor protein involved in Fe transport|nr:TonB-dependent receptor [Caulobacteraceae bacterium]